MHRYRTCCLLGTLILLGAGSASGRAGTIYLETNLVTDISGFAARTDGVLQNP
jgi:hypothetical protein